MGSRSSRAVRALLAGAAVSAVVLASATAAPARQGPSGPVFEPAPADGPRGVDAAFAAIRKSLIESGAPENEEAPRLDLELDVEPDAVVPPGAKAAVVFARPGESRRSLREAVRYETRLVGSEIMPGAQIGAGGAGGVAGAAQERARRAVIDAVSSTSLGKSMGRFLYYQQETGLEGDRNPLIPRVKPKLRYRSREVGLSLVWRF